MVSHSRLRALHRRCDGDTSKAPAARRSHLAGTPRALLPAHGTHGPRSSLHGVACLRCDDGLRGGDFVWAHPTACRAGHRLRRRERVARRRRSLGRRRLDALSAPNGKAGMNFRRLMVFAHDVVAAGVAWTVAFWLRFNLDVPKEYEALMLARLPWVIAIHAAVFWALGLYRGLWRYASLPDMQRILLAVGVAALAVPATLTLLGIRFGVPRTVYVLTPLLLMLIAGGNRLAYRALKEGRLAPLITKPKATTVLVLGAGSAAAALLKDLAASTQWRVVGLLDDDAGKRGAEVGGVKVLGGIGDVRAVAERLGVEQAVIAMPSATHGERKRAVDLCTVAGLSVMTVPALSDIVAGNVSVSAFRPIELDDLLGRDPVELDSAGVHAFLDGKTVLIAGCGGSIGAER